jgi:hypothetical protein
VIAEHLVVDQLDDDPNAPAAPHDDFPCGEGHPDEWAPADDAPPPDDD